MSGLDLTEASAYTSFKRNLKKFLRLNGKLHRELVHNLLGIAVDNKPDGLLCGYASLIAVKHLVFADYR